MKLRLSNNQITFRIQQEELEGLQEGRELFQTLVLPNGSPLNFSVLPDHGQEGIVLDCPENTLKLGVSPAALAHLAMEPSRKGVVNRYTAAGKTVDFSLELDFFSNK